MSMKRQPAKAIDYLAQLVIKEVLERPSDLAGQIGHDEYLKKYIARRNFFVKAAGIFITLTFFVATIVLFSKLFIHLPSLATWQKLAALILGILFWLGGTVIFMYLLLASLKRSALIEKAQEENQSAKGTPESSSH